LEENENFLLKKFFYNFENSENYIQDTFFLRIFSLTDSKILLKKQQKHTTKHIKTTKTHNQTHKNNKNTQPNT